jgi:hypothetical protein
MTTQRATPLATPVRLRRLRSATDRELVARLHPAYAEAIGRLPGGRRTLRGIPFRLPREGPKRRWLLLDRPVDIDLTGVGPASHVVIAHFCDAWRDPSDRRPEDLPVGWVMPPGEPLARYVLETARGRPVERVIRRRFEINEGIVGWGQGAFAAVPHLVDQPLDWRGPHPVPPPGGYAAPGHAGLLGILPGSWGPDQTGVADSVPSPTGDIALWLHAIEVPGRATDLVRLRMEPLADVDHGGAVVVAAVTAFRGIASPLVLAGRRTLRVAGGGDSTRVGVDLGQVFRSRPAPLRLPTSSRPTTGRVVGWGSEPADACGRAVDVDLALAPDATLAIRGERVPAGRLPEEGRRRRFGALTIQSLPTPARRVEVEVVDATTGEPMPARVRFRSADGRYLPPLGHRDEVNIGLNEDTGADLALGDETYAYVPGRFPIDLPVGRVDVEVVHGFDRRPLRRTLDVGGGRAPLRLALEAAGTPADPRWIAVDTHVHFISPTSALLQARAEGVEIVNLLATQWGDHHTSVTDLPAAVVADPSGRHQVVMGSENRQNMLGHIGLLGAHDPVLPMASAGPPEARLGDPLAWLMRDWADAAHAQDGLAVAVHFPLPYAEVAADIVAGRIDAVELQALTPGADGPSIREWYRYLACGFRLPVVGGTDKMSAEIPLGAIRTYARLESDEPPTFSAWAQAVKAGRTFVSSGAFVELRVEGHEPGDAITFGRDGGTVEVRAEATAAQPVVDGLELVHDGAVVAATTGRRADRLALDERIRIERSGWLAVRVRSDATIRSGFSTNMGAHSSPVYLDVDGRPPFDAGDAAAIGTIIDGARTWIEDVAPVRSPAERARLAAFLTDSRKQLDRLARERTRRSRVRC